MPTHIRYNSTFTPSEHIVAREIEGEIVIVPLTAGIGNADDELYTLNDTGKEIWKRLDGKRTLQDVSRELSAEFEDSTGQIEKDVIGFADELLKRGILVEISGT